MDHRSRVDDANLELEILTMRARSIGGDPSNGGALAPKPSSRRRNGPLTLVVSIACLFAPAGACRAQFIPTTGIVSYTDPANWLKKDINGDFKSTIKNLEVTFSADYTMKTGWKFLNEGTGLTVRSKGKAVTVTLGGDVLMKTDSTTGLTNTIGDKVNGLDVNLGGNRKFTIDGKDTLRFLNVVTGTGNVTKDGTGTMIFGSSATYTGSTTIDAGTIKIGTNDGLPTGTTLNLKGTFDLNGSNQTVKDISSVAAGTGTVTNSNGTKTATFTVNTAGKSSYSGILSGNLALEMAGSGTLTLSRPAGATANSYTGGTKISGGTLQLGSADVLPKDTVVSVSKPGTLDLNDNTQHIAGLNGNGTVTNSGKATPGLVVTISDPDPKKGSVFSGSITQKVQLFKDGPGTLTLSGVSTYTGGTNVIQGTLTVNTAKKDGSGTGTNDVTLTAGTTLDGKGFIAGNVINKGGTIANTLTIGGKVTVADAGQVAPGTLVAAGTLTFGSLDMNGGGTYDWKLTQLTDAAAARGVLFDAIDLDGGNLALGAGSIVALQFAPGIVPGSSDAFWQTSHTWDLIHLTDGATNMGNTDFGSIAASAGGAGLFTTVVASSLDASAGFAPGDILLEWNPVITTAAVPEPSSWSLLLFGFTVGALAARRRPNDSPLERRLVELASEATWPPGNDGASPPRTGLDSAQKQASNHVPID
jgi:autotransporter-associated beta strand protein